MIADFLGKHGKALRKLFRDTLQVLIEAKLVTLSHVAIDGSKVEADAGKNSVRSEEKIRSWQAHLDEKIAALEQERAENEQREASLFGETNSEAGPLSEATQEALALVGEDHVLTESQWAALPRNNQGLIDKSACVYDESRDVFRCPAGQTLAFLSTSQDKKKWGTAKGCDHSLWHHWSGTCRRAGSTRRNRGRRRVEPALPLACHNQWSHPPPSARSVVWAWIDYLTCMEPPELQPEILLGAYASGIFPMADDDGELMWFSPDPRAIIPLDAFHVSDNLRRRYASHRFTLTVNRAFEPVMTACADRGEGTWISEEIVAAYARIHVLGFAHSVEAWRDDALVGGLYGVAMGGAFFGESMFHLETDASKVALVFLVERLNERGFSLLDVQFMTSHLARFGAIEIPREAYLERLEIASSRTCVFADEPDT